MAQKAAYLAALGGGGGGGGARALLDGERASGDDDDIVVVEWSQRRRRRRRCDFDDASMQSYLNAVMRMRVVETKRCLKETGCGKVPSHLKAKELQRLVFLCAVYPTEDEGMQREVGWRKKA